MLIDGVRIEKKKENQQLHLPTIAVIKFDKAKSNTDISMVRMIRYDYITTYLRQLKPGSR